MSERDDHTGESWADRPELDRLEIRQPCTGICPCHSQRASTRELRTWARTERRIERLRARPTPPRPRHAPRLAKPRRDR